MKVAKLLGIMAEQDITQAKLAKEIGISKNTLNAKLRLKRPFTSTEIYKICDVLHISDPLLKCEIFLS